MPTLAGYLLWIRNFMGVPVSALPDNSIYITYSFAAAQEIVPDELNLVSAFNYTDATYNLAAHILITTVQDQPGAVFSGYIAGNNLTVVLISSGTIASGQSLSAVGLNALVIGGSGYAWEVNPAQNYGSVLTPFTMTSTLNYFANLRAQFKVFQFVAGVVQTSGDEGSQTTIAVTDAMKGLKFSELNYNKTPYGNNYIAYVQPIGSPFGMS